MMNIVLVTSNTKSFPVKFISSHQPQCSGLFHAKLVHFPSIQTFVEIFNEQYAKHMHSNRHASERVVNDVMTQWQMTWNLS